MTSSQPSALVISIADRDVGVAIRERGGFQFVAADPSFAVLDGSRFRRIDQLERAASNLARVVAQPVAQSGRTRH
jgi:hypothetical protein